MKVLVFQVSNAGHYLQWAGTLARALADIGAKVTLALPKGADQTENFRFHIAPHLNHVAVDAWFEPSALSARRGLNALPTVLESIRRHDAERVYLPTADGIAQYAGALATLGKAPFPPRVAVEALIMNGTVAHSHPKLRARLWARASFATAKRGPWSTFFHLDPFVHDWEARRGVAPANRVHTMPEPLEPGIGLTRAEARRKLSLDEDGYYVGMAGGITERKGADLALLGFEQARLPKDSRLLLCGKATPGVRALAQELRQRRPDLSARIVLVDRVVSDEELLTSLCALDLVLLPYGSGHLSSSGIASRAIVAGRPILITPGSWGEKMSRIFRPGWVAPLPDPKALAAQLELRREAAQNWVAPEENRRFIEYNSIPNFAAHWSAGLCDALGVSPAPIKSWQWARGQAELP
jgi:glycosyltransferase involved in cell wall biosynthesis